MVAGLFLFYISCYSKSTVDLEDFVFTYTPKVAFFPITCWAVLSWLTDWLAGKYRDGLDLLARLKRAQNAMVEEESS